MSYLKHHGIRGQRWGVKNGPPYPLEEGAHSSREKRLAKTGSRSKRLTSSESSNRDVTAKKKGLTKGQKTAIKVGAAIAVTALAAAGGYALYKSGKLNVLAEKGLNYLNSRNGESGLGRLKDKSGSFIHRTPVDESSRINPNYGQKGFDTNCSYCSVAYEMRRRGYLVQPGPAAPDAALTDTQLQKAFTKIPEDSIINIKDLKVSPYPEASDFVGNGKSYAEGLTNLENALTKRGDEVINSIKSEISKYPPGSRGIFGIMTRDGGHEMAWEIGKDSKVILLNPQDQSDSIDSVDFRQWFGGYLSSSDLIKENPSANLADTGIQILRTDQLTLSNFGKTLLRTESGDYLPMSTSEKLVSGTAVVGTGAAVAGVDYLGNKISRSIKKEKK